MHLEVSIITAQHFIQAFSLMLIHSLWQGLLFAGIAAAFLIVYRKARSTLRYNMVGFMCVLFLVACVLTFMYEWNQLSLEGFLPKTTHQQGNSPASGFKILIPALNQLSGTLADFVSSNSLLITGLWLILFLYRATKLTGGILFLQRARRRRVFLPSGEWQRRIDRICQRLAIFKAVQLLESGYITIPMVIGHIKPVILVPLGFLTGLPAQQVEAVLIHELAHIRRSDYLVNMVQTITETVFFFNPGLVWMSSLLREERENCCDDLAIEQTGNKREFIEALISFKEFSFGDGSYAVAFPGKKNQLLQRVSRILNNGHQKFGGLEKGFLLGGLIAILISVTSAVVAARQPRAKIAKQPVERAAVAAIAAIAPVPVAPVKITPRTKDAGQVTPHTFRKQKPTTSHLGEAVQNPIVKQAKVSAELEEKNQEQARQNVIQQEKNKEQERLNAIQAEKNRKQVLLNQVQVRKNEEQARLNKIQEAKNLDQEWLNRIQVLKNQEQVLINEMQAASQTQTQSNLKEQLEKLRQQESDLEKLNEIRKTQANITD